MQYENMRSYRIRSCCFLNAAYTCMNVSHISVKTFSDLEACAAFGNKRDD